MKKSGFTLAEVLIAVGIIGVMGAIMATTFNNVKPDRTKFLYLKAYDGLKASINSMIYNKYIYSSSYSVDTMVAGASFCRTYDTSNYPLLDFDAPVDPNFSDVNGGQFKFANLLRESLNGDGNVCNVDGCSFTTKPGNLTWTIDNQIEGLMNAPTSGQIHPDYRITLTITDNNGNPRQFLFHVYADGTVRPDDNDDGFSYIMHRTNLRSRNDDPSVTSQIHDTLDFIQVDATSTDWRDVTFTQTSGTCE